MFLSFSRKADKLTLSPPGRELHLLCSHQTPTSSYRKYLYDQAASCRAVVELQGPAVSEGYGHCCRGEQTPGGKKELTALK